MADGTGEGFAAPGERRIRVEGKASEITVPWGQYVRLMVALGILFVAVSFVAWIIGPGTLWGLGMLPVLALTALSQNVGERSSGPRVVATMTALTVVLFWALNGYGLCAALWPFSLVAWAAMIKLWIIAGMLLVVCAPTAWIAYRYAAEIADPSGPTAPRAAVSRAGTQWPWSGEIHPPGALNLDEIRQVMEQMLSQQPPRETMRVEIVEGATGTGGVQTGGGISMDDLPVNQETMRQLVSIIDLGHCKWSRRDVASIDGIGDDQARELMRVLVECGFLHYPLGPNHPGGAVLTRKGQAFMRGLLA